MLCSLIYAKRDAVTLFVLTESLCLYFSKEKFAQKLQEKKAFFLQLWLNSVSDLDNWIYSLTIYIYTGYLSSHYSQWRSSQYNQQSLENNSPYPSHSGISSLALTQIYTISGEIPWGTPPSSNCLSEEYRSPLCTSHSIPDSGHLHVNDSFTAAQVTSDANFQAT